VNTYTVDELRALARIGGYWLPAAILDQDEDDRRVDLAALRGLVVRGLVDSGAPTPALAVALEPLRAPRLVAEIETETGWHAIVAGDRTVVLTGQSGGITAVSQSSEPVETVLMRLFDVEIAPAAGTGFQVGLDALADADEYVVGGDTAAAVRTLCDAGAPSPAAVAWVRAIETRRYSAHVRVAYRDGERYVADEVRWLVGGDGAAWTTSPTGTVTPVGPAQLRAALTALVTGR
jgi:hypothetical protein